MIHSAATRANQHFDKDDILLWHTGPKSEGHRGWRKAGYSDIILLGGEVQNLYPYDADEDVDAWELINGAVGHICYIGGRNAANTTSVDTRTSEQRAAMAAYVKVTLMLQPWLKLIGHNQVAQKACPSFDVREWAKEIGIKDENIDFNNYVGNSFIRGYDGG